MNHYKAALLTVVGGLLGWAFASLSAFRPVRAQEVFASLGSCTVVVPKSWGDFKGGSTYGLAFQDEHGTLRFVEHPNCGSVSSSMSAPQAAIDLEIEKKVETGTKGLHRRQ
jgi:hypothetical protein